MSFQFNTIKTVCQNNSKSFHTALFLKTVTGKSDFGWTTTVCVGVGPYKYINKAPAVFFSAADMFPAVTQNHMSLMRSRSLRLC